MVRRKTASKAKRSMERLTVIVSSGVKQRIKEIANDLTLEMGLPEERRVTMGIVVSQAINELLDEVVHWKGGQAGWVKDLADKIGRDGDESGSDGAGLPETDDGPEEEEGEAEAGDPDKDDLPGESER